MLIYINNEKKQAPKAVSGEKNKKIYASLLYPRDFRYKAKPKECKSWIENHRSILFDYLMYNLELLSIKQENKELFIEFLVLNNDLSDNDQAVKRLESIKSIIPYCEKYCSDGIWTLPLGKVSSVDGTHKRMPTENLPIRSDVDKNMIFIKALEAAYNENSYYQFQKFWIELRKELFLFVRLLCQLMRKFIARDNFSKKFLQSVIDGINNLSEKLEWLPELPIDGNVNLNYSNESSKENKLNRWAFFLHNFLRFLPEFCINRSNKENSRVLLHNLREVINKFHVLKSEFEKIFKESPDYFEAIEFSENEKVPYIKLEEYIDCLIHYPPSYLSTGEISAYISNEKKAEKERDQEKFLLIKSKLEEMGIDITIPTEKYIEYPLTYLGIAVSIAEESDIIDKILPKIALVLLKFKDMASFFFIIPICDDVRFETGFRINSEDLSLWANNEELPMWEAKEPMPIPEGILNTLPKYSVYSHTPSIQDYHNGILLQLAFLHNIWEKIRFLNNSKNDLKEKLYIKLKNNYNDIVDECISFAGDQMKRIGQVEGVIEQEHDEISTKEIIDFYRKITNSSDFDELIKLADEYGINDSSLGKFFLCKRP